MVCGKPLFDGASKFETACGWPAFSLAAPAVATNIDDTDYSRIEGHNHSEVRAHAQAL